MTNCWVRTKGCCLSASWGFTNYLVVRLFWAVVLLSVLGLFVSVLYYTDDLSQTWTHRKMVGISNSRVFDFVSKPTGSNVAEAKHGYTTALILPNEKSNNNSLLESRLVNADSTMQLLNGNATLKRLNSTGPIELQTERSVVQPTMPSSAGNEDCLLWRDTHEHRKDVIKPQITLDHDKFLYPGLIWGPNNQIVGFWQSIYLAIQLNRTLVMPRFHGHGTTGGGIIPAAQRVDVERIRRFVSSVSIESFSKMCDSSFDVVLQAQKTDSNAFKRFERDTGMKILYINEERIFREERSTQLRITDEGHVDAPNIPAYPPESYELTFNPWISGKRDALLRAYNTSASCALYSAPFSTIRVHIINGVALPLSSSNANQLGLSDEEIYSAVLDSVRRPVAIVKAVEQYKAEVFGNEPYVAVHWRYDFKDWGGSRCRPDHPNKYSKMCEELRNITSEDVASGIFTSLNKTNVNQWKHIYIASPPILRDFSDQVVEVLQKLNRKVENSKRPLDAFITDRYQPCWKQGEWINEKEIFSLSEMEVLAQSEWFFYASGSTFSSNVRPMRREKKQDGKIGRKFERSIYDVAKNAMVKRTRGS